VTLEQAEVAFAGVPPFITRVGVFVDADAAFVAEAVARLGLGAVQFHGSETPEACAAAPVPAIKAFRIGPAFSAAAVAPYEGAVSAVLFDAFVAGVAGGTGRTFPWREAAAAVPEWAPLVLAGGLASGNVGAAVAALHPFAVDVSSAVEVSPGVKDPARMLSFVAAVRAAEEED
jgi:phosphoribosylanthranilate isomerase